MTILVILFSLLSWHSIFMRHSIPLQISGWVTRCVSACDARARAHARGYPPSHPPAHPLRSYCAAAMFVIASFDYEAAVLFCAGAARRCDPDTDYQHTDPTLAGNLWPAPYLDYTVFVIWLFTGAVLTERGNVIAKIAEDLQREATLLAEIAKSTGAPAAMNGEVYTEAVPQGGY